MIKKKIKIIKNKKRNASSVLGSFQPSGLGGASGFSVPELRHENRAGGRHNVVSCLEDEWRYLLRRTQCCQGIVLVLVLVLTLLWHNLIIRLSFKCPGYHNCLLNNSINLSERNLWLDCKPGETPLDAPNGADMRRLKW